MAAKKSSIVTPQPPGRTWLCRIGHGFQISNNRKATKMPPVSSQLVLNENASMPGNVPVCQYRAPIQELKHMGIAVTSSNTTEPGSFCPSTRSANPQSHTERDNPSRVPRRKLQKLPVASNR